VTVGKLAWYIPAVNVSVVTSVSSFPQPSWDDRDSETTWADSWVPCNLVLWLIQKLQIIEHGHKI
jgi:hypothetical protein